MGIRATCGLLVLVSCGLAACGSADKPATARLATGPVLGCADGGAARSPLPPGWRAASIVSGPLTLADVRQYADQPARAFRPSHESLRAIIRAPGSTARERRLARRTLRDTRAGDHGVLEGLVRVAAGREVTLSVAPAQRASVRLVFSRAARNRHGSGAGYRLADGDRTVTFRACDAASTDFLGGYVVAGARCVRLTVSTRGRPAAELRIPFGARCGRPVAAAGVPPGAGIRADVPEGWRRIGPPITAVSYPAERLLLTSYPTARGGNCGPERALRDLPPGGALIYLFEYRPRVGDPWANLRRRDFPPRPAHFALRRSTLGTYECWGATPSHLIRFRDADRPFQLHVALRRRASAARRRQVLRILDSLRISPLPPPPPDPFAGWRTLVDETGDSLRTPPRWPAATTTSPRRYPRPRALFFASNRRLKGLAPAPPRRARVPRRLPSPFPAAALGAMPADGVLLWVLEERPGGATPAFPPTPRRWPTPRHFAPTTSGAASRWPALTWERAAGSHGGHRFSVWVISGSAASAADRALARKAASALALSTGGFRDAPCRRACRSG